MKALVLILGLLAVGCTHSGYSFKEAGIKEITCAGEISSQGHCLKEKGPGFSTYRSRKDVDGDREAYRIKVATHQIVRIHPEKK